MFKTSSRAFRTAALAAVYFSASAALPRTSRAAPNPGVVEIDEPSAYSRVVAVSDAHGMSVPLRALLKNGKITDDAGNWSAGATLLIITGDSIDKGPGSADVIDLWLALSGQAAASGGRVVHLLGNHEASFLADPEGEGKAQSFRDELKARGIPLEEFTEPGRPRADFLRSMPAAARVGKWLFCHSGRPPDKPWDKFKAKAAEVLSAGNYGAGFFSKDDSILESADWWETEKGRKEAERRLDSNGLFGVVFGHRPKAFGAEGRCAASTDRRLVKIDNGMAPASGGHGGSLLVFPKPEEMAAGTPASLFSVSSAGAELPL